MGFFSNIVSSVVKVAVTPIAVATDAVKVATGQEPDTTKNLLQSASDDASEAIDDLFE